MAGNSILQAFYDEIDANYHIDYTTGFTLNYLHVPFLLSALYLVLVFAGKRFMHNKTPLSLRIPLTLWNAALAAYSILAFCIMTPPVISRMFTDGFSYSICNSPCRHSPWLSFWALSFVFSKVVELGDTFFVVVRKSPLNFLHWYHHITVLCYTWYCLGSRNEAGHWFTAINLLVHSVMYTYYMFKSMNVRVPSKVALFITLLQLSQFVVGIIIVFVGTYRYVYDLPCGIKQSHLIAGFLMYGSYFVLFLNFFYHRYIKPKPKKKEL